MRNLGRPKNRQLGERNAEIATSLLGLVQDQHRNVFNIEAQRQALRNLDSLSMFSNIEVYPLPDEKQEGGILVGIKLKEDKQTKAGGGNVSFVYRNIEGLNRSIIGSVVTSSMLNPQDDLAFKLEYVHPYLDGQGVGIGSSFPMVNRHQLTMTKFIQLKNVEEGVEIGKENIFKDEDAGSQKKVAAELRVPVVNTPVGNTVVYVFAEHGNDLGSSEDANLKPSEYSWFLLICRA
ncbi:protein TOC75-3, chloroplastic [Tanacetum coccineum]